MEKRTKLYRNQNTPLKLQEPFQESLFMKLFIEADDVFHSFHFVVFAVT